MTACGGSSPPSAPTAPPTPDTTVAAGTVLSVTSGETGQPVAGAQVVVAGRRYDTDAGGQVTLTDRIPYGSLVDVTAPDFLDRQTLLRKNGTRRFVLWPRSTPWGLNEAYTAELVSIPTGPRTRRRSAPRPWRGSAREQRKPWS